MRRPITLPIAVLLVATGLAAGTSAASATCASTGHPGGDWPSYGHDLGNSRHQPDADITPLNAATLAPAWTFSARAAGGDGDFTGTPIVSDGCMFIGSNTGWVFALNADTGASVWKTKLDAPSDGGLFPGGIPSSLAVAEGVVYANVNRVDSPYLAALDASSGTVLWETLVSDEAGATLYASPVVYDGLVFVGVSSPGAGFSGSFVLVDAADGSIIRRTPTIPPGDVAQGYFGAGIWSTAAVDASTGYAFVGTGEPDEGAREHENANAIIKIDLERSRSTFGEIVDSYKNNIYDNVPGFAAADPHFDFGASPTLFSHAGGTRVGALQRAGVFHAVDADTMAGAWTTIVGPTQILGNASSGAYDGTALYGSVNPGNTFSLAPDDGMPRWISPSADGVRYHPVSSANGVIYTLDVKGFLDAYDAQTGLPLLHRPIVAGAATGADPVLTLGSGVSIARDTVYAAVGVGLSAGVEGYVVAFRTLV